MQKLKVEQKLFSFSPKYVVTDEQDNLIAYANRHLFSWKKKASLFDKNEKHLYDITRKPFSWGRSYYIEDQQGPLFFVKRNWGFKSKLIVQSMNHDDIIVQGNIWSTEYSFYQNDQEFAFVSKKMWSLNDKYGIGIINDYDRYVIIALVLIIDMIIRQRRSS